MVLDAFVFHSCVIVHVYIVFGFWHGYLALLAVISYIDLISFVKVLHSPSNLELRHTVPHSQKKKSLHFFFVLFVLLQTSTKLTAAQKSLSKVDKKGMKSISSFFGAAVGSKKTKKR